MEFYFNYTNKGEFFRIALDMYCRSSLSSLRIITTFSYHFNSFTCIRSSSVLTNSNINPCILPPSSLSLCLTQSQRTFMFWRSNVDRELYGSPTKAAATRKNRRLQKTITQIIRDGQLMRFLKEAFLPEWKKWWKEMQPWDRKYCK